jgi:hypothetical protein
MVVPGFSDPAIPKTGRKFGRDYGIA